MLEDLEAGEMEFESAEEFLVASKKEFGEGDKEMIKVAKLKRIEQEGRTIKEFIQEFKRAARRSSYEGRPLIEEFKKEMSEAIRRKLMETERPPTSIEQWYKCATNLNRHWRESKKKKERLRGRREQGTIASRQQEVSRQMP